MTKSIRVVARISAHPEKVEELKAVFLELIEPTRQENGCIKYELLQNQSDPTEFTFVEEWTSDEALDAHLGSAHIQTAVAKLKDLVASDIDIRRYTLLA
ncbi:antibiotic biosynthesis monooxygenase [Mastigocladus laminosus UU774]|nr:antibiotic biosynthesis monooxygenase [Westiellopsis prolifica IICB1]TFI56206.1 antibiotic biosynthesis monooxygenase [Mastigocladus laminosus UU774]